MKIKREKQKEVDFKEVRVGYNGIFAVTRCLNIRLRLRRHLKKRRRKKTPQPCPDHRDANTSWGSSFSLFFVVEYLKAGALQP